MGLRQDAGRRPPFVPVKRPCLRAYGQCYLTLSATKVVAVALGTPQGIANFQNPFPANGRGRDDHRWPPPAQIRTCAFTHTALTEDGWRRSAYRDKDAEHGVVESTDPAAG